MGKKFADVARELKKEKELMQKLGISAKDLETANGVPIFSDLNKVSSEEDDREDNKDDNN